jgi:hypothetical protein
MKYSGSAVSEHTTVKANTRLSGLTRAALRLRRGRAEKRLRF